MDHEERCADLYAQGTKQPVRDGLVVIGTTDCQLCKNSMRNNDYKTATSDGTPITWLNMEDAQANHLIYSIPGIAYQNDAMTAAGKAIAGLPVVLFVEAGCVIRPPQKYGELMDGELETLCGVMKA